MLFPYFFKQVYRYAPHDQRHEIKTAALLNFSPVRLSLDYVYGSGFMDRTRVLIDQEVERYPYRRIDAAVSYKFSGLKYFLEAGFSILNLLTSVFRREFSSFNSGLSTIFLDDFC